MTFSLVRRARQAVWVVVGIGVLLVMRAKSTRSDTEERQADVVAGPAEPAPGPAAVA